jgi:hypothetical protein
MVSADAPSTTNPPLAGPLTTEAVAAEASASLLVYPPSNVPVTACGPVETLAWVITVRPTRKGGRLDRDEVARVFGPDWAEELFPGGSVTLFGQPLGEKSWVYVEDEDGPEAFGTIALSVSLRDARGKAPNEKTLAAFAEAVREDAADLGGVASFRESPRDAVARAKEQIVLHRSIGDVSASFLLVAPEATPFAGRALVDALFAEGLVIDDEGVFHWENTPDRPGDRSLFRVSTTTPPECFLEEDLEAGATFENLVFDLAIARTAEPSAVLEVMLAVARSLQHELGGDLLNDEGNVLDPRVLRARVEATAERLVFADFVPGGAAALAFF